MQARTPEDCDRLFGEYVNAGEVEGVVALYEEDGNRGMRRLLADSGVVFRSAPQTTQPRPWYSMYFAVCSAAGRPK
jgi:hypothetical protein